MKMFFISISMFHSYWHLSAAFQVNIACLRVGPPILGITCADLSAFTGVSASLIAIIAALAASMVVCVIACIRFCLAVISLLYFLWKRLPVVSLLYFLYVSLPYVRLLSSYFLGFLFFCLVCLTCYFLPFTLTHIGGG